MNRQCISRFVLLATVLCTAIIFAAEESIAPLVKFQRDTSLVIHKNTLTSWQESIGNSVMAQGVYREVTKGYYDTLMLENTSLILVWNEREPKPENGMPIEIQGDFVQMTYGIPPAVSQSTKSSQGTNLVRAYGIRVRSWKQIARIVRPVVWSFPE